MHSARHLQVRAIFSSAGRYVNAQWLRRNAGVLVAMLVFCGVVAAAACFGDRILPSLPPVDPKVSAER